MNAMLTSRVLRIWLVILLVFELPFPVRSTQHNKVCYPVGNREVCFFRPQPNFTSAEQRQAWEICRSSNGTLPMISDKAIQGVLEKYMISMNLTDLGDMWLAGQEVRRREFTWANGDPFPEWAYLAQTQNESQPHDLQAVLTKDLKYRKEPLGNKKNYVCQFFGAACQSKDTIPLKNGCLLFNDGETSNFYDSRNKCIERGGDLAIIDGPDDLNKFPQVFGRFPGATKLWIGLRRQWWIWGGSASANEVKYSNWEVDNGFQLGRPCMVAELNEFRWKQENCTSNKRFICQIGVADVESPFNPKPDEPRLIFIVVLVAGISIPVITILLVVVIVTAIMKKRKSRPRQPSIVATPTDTSYLNLDPNLDEEGYLKSNPHYTPLVPSTRKPPPLPPPTVRPITSQKQELNPDYLYEEIADIGVRSYLEITP